MLHREQQIEHEWKNALSRSYLRRSTRKKILGVDGPGGLQRHKREMMDGDLYKGSHRREQRK